MSSRLVQLLLSGDLRALARAISLVEEHAPSAGEVLPLGINQPPLLLGATAIGVPMADALFTVRNVGEQSLFLVDLSLPFAIP